MRRIGKIGATLLTAGILLALLTVTSGSACGSDDADTAPSFSGPTLDGKTVSLDQYRGKPLLLIYMTHT